MLSSFPNTIPIIIPFGSGSINSEVTNLDNPINRNISFSLIFLYEFIHRTNIAVSVAKERKSCHFISVYLVPYLRGQCSRLPQDYQYSRLATAKFRIGM